MSQPKKLTAAVALVTCHDILLLAAIFYAPIFWGQVAIAESTAMYLISASAGQTLVGLLVGLAVLSALVARWSQGQPPARLPNAIHLPAALLLVIGLITTLTSVNPHASWLELTRLAMGTAFFFLVANRATLPASRPGVVAAGFGCSLLLTAFVSLPPESAWVIRLFAIVATSVGIGLIVTGREQQDPVVWWRNALVLTAAMVVALYGWREKVSVARDLNNPTWPIFSTFFNSNPLGGFFALVFPLALGAAIVDRVFLRRLLWSSCAIILAVTLLPTYSKGAMLAWAVAFVTFVLLLARQLPKLRRPAGVVLVTGGVVLVAIALALLASSALRTRAAGVLDIHSSSNMFRIFAWRGTIALFLAHPWVGVGPGAFKYAFPQYALAGYVEAAHQNYLQAFAEMGVLGGIVFLWLFGAVLFTGARALRRAKTLGGAALAIGGISSVVALMIHSFLDYDWYLGAIQFSFWLVAGMLAHLAHGQPIIAPVVEAPLAQVARKKSHRTQAASIPHTGLTMGAPFRWPRVTTGGALAFGIAWCLLTGGIGLLCYQGVLLSGRNVVAQHAIDLGDRYAHSGLKDAGAMALGAYDQARQADPTWAEAWERYGLLLGVNTGLDAGIRAIEQAAACSPTNYRPYASMGYLYGEFREWREAARSFQRALELFPNGTKTMKQLAEAYEQAGDRENALAAWQRLVGMEGKPLNQYRALETVDVDTNFAFAHYALGLAAPRAGTAPGAADATKHYQRVLAIVADYFARAKATDDMFKLLGRPREYRAEDMKMLEAKTRWRLAELLQQTSDAPGADEQRLQARAAWPDIEQLIAAEDGMQQ